MADKKIKVKVDVEANVAPTIANLKALKKQLKETAAGSDDFNKISAAIRDMDDSIKDASAGADDFAGFLENASGPLGMFGKGLRSAEKAFSSFNAILKTSIIGILVAAIGGLVAAFTQSETAMKKLEPLFIAFEKILGGIFRAFEPVLDAFIEMAVEALPFITKGIGMFYSGLFSLFTLVKNVGVSVGKILKGIFTLDFDALKEGAAGIKDAFTSVGKTFDDTYKRFEEGTKEQTKTQKENAAERQKILDEERKKREAAAAAAAAEAKRIREAELKELLDGQKDAFLELLSEREAEEYKVNEHYSNLIGLAVKYGDDTTQLKLAQSDALKEIDDKYLARQKEQEAKDKEKKLKEAEELAKAQLKQLEDLKKLDEERVASNEMANRAIAQSWIDLGQNISTVFGSLINVFGQGSAAAKAFGVAQVAINAAAAIGSIILNNKQAQAEFNKAIAAGKATIALGIANSAIPGMQPIAAAQLVTGKSAIAAAVAGKATAKVNSIAQIATVGVTSAAQIATILSAGKSRSTGTGGAGASADTSISTPTPPSVAGASAPQILTTGGMNPSQQIGETIAASQRPLRAYVVSGEVSSQMALDRRTSRAATFVGG